jgi:hypothetical protein
MNDEKTPERNPLREVEAMRRIVEAMADLPPDAAARVLRWARDSFAPREQMALAPEAATTSEPGTAGSAGAEFNDLPSLFAAARPKGGPEMALVVGYWFQSILGQQDLDAQSLHRELKHLGHGLANVTSTMTLLMSQKPQLVIQTRKTGTTTQARKRYRLTSAGLQRVEQMIREKGRDLE